MDWNSPLWLRFMTEVAGQAHLTVFTGVKYSLPAQLLQEEALRSRNTNLTLLEDLHNNPPRLNHTAKSYPLDLGMPPGVTGCLQMLMCSPSEYITDELWTRLHKLYVSCDSDGSRVRLARWAGAVTVAPRGLRRERGGVQVGTRCWETGGFTAMHVRQAQLFKRLHCCDQATSDDVIDNFSYMPPVTLKRVVDTGRNHDWEAYDAAATPLFKRAPLAEHPYLDHCDGLGTCRADNMHVLHLGWQVQTSLSHLSHLSPLSPLCPTQLNKAFTQSVQY